MYTLIGNPDGTTSTKGVMRDDGSFIPNDHKNTDWQAYQAWLAAGGVAAPFTPIPAAPVSTDFLGFLALFTSDEDTNIFTARRSDVNIDRFITMAAGASVVTLSDPRVVAGINYLVSMNLLTSTRAAQVLAGTPPTGS